MTEKPLTPKQAEALHALATVAADRTARIDGNAGNALEKRGYATSRRAYYGARPTFTITAEGRKAHDAIFTPEKLAADQAEAEAARAARVHELQERRHRYEAHAAERNAAAAELRRLVGPDVSLPYGLTAETTVSRDGSGIWGGEGRITNTELLAIVKAALAEAGRPTTISVKTCPVCGRSVEVHDEGYIVDHEVGGQLCKGSGR